MHNKDNAKQFEIHSIDGAGGSYITRNRGWLAHIGLQVEAQFEEGPIPLLDAEAFD
jgi:hypothetical protein